jgi:hypothetical protein
MSTKTKTSKQVLELALIIFKRYAMAWAMYDAECAEYAKDGFRPSHCFHGTNMWTDYDPMCGPCEDGYSWFNRNAYRALALAEAHRAHDKQAKRIQMLIELRSEGAPISITELGKWATEPVQTYYPKAEQREGYAALSKCEPPF